MKDKHMTVEKIKRRIARFPKEDNEGAHVNEDQLWIDVLTTIAAGAENPSELAAAALKTLDLDFDRWYA